MYLRFATFRTDPDALRPQGVFQRTYALLDGGELHPEEVRILRAALGYFEHDMAVPRVHQPRAVFWFKAECAMCTHHGWLLANALKASGVPVVPLRTVKPGLVVYEDDCQIAAVPYRDTFRSPARRGPRRTVPRSCYVRRE